MKNIFKITVAFLVVMTMTMVSCATDDDVVRPTPIINYVRITDPISSDSLIVKAGQGQLLALMGDNLQNTVEVWFNNRQAFIKPTYVSKNSILTNVPSKIPTEINNQIRLVSNDGSEYTYNFTVDIGEPYLKGMLSEYVPAGKIAVIQGDYFYEPLTVTFTGGAQGTVSSIQDNKILNVIVPEGAQPGPITVTSNFGSTISDFYFRDNRNIFVSSDPFKGYSGKEFLVTNPGDADPIAINGNYIRVSKPIGAWQWTPFVEGSNADFGEESKNIPADAILHPENYNFKFEVNTLKPYNANAIKFQLAMNGTMLDNALAYIWKPPFDTKGQWETVSIPFSEIVKLSEPTVNPDGYYVRFLFHGDGGLDADMSFDNFRVVPKELKLN